ncbi:uncharacterized protein LOC144651536 [Oculina patagonica]
MANVEARRNGFLGRLSSKIGLCQYNSAGNKASDWWLFLFLAYIACLLVGIVFVIAGFTSTDFQMSAVGVVLVIAGACLAIVCDVLRRFGCGWTKIATEAAIPGQLSQEDSDFTLSLPYLPGYPGFCTAGENTRPANPPPYAICESDEFAARPTLSCTCGASLRTENAQTSDASCVTSYSRHTVSLEAAQPDESPSGPDLRELPHEHVAPSTTPASGSLEPTAHKPAPPPYDFVLVNSEGRLSWLCDSPPPYADFV